jgi:RNA polymerase sigma-70 factor (ECF subfamily)
VFAAARAAWPEIDLDEERFLAYLRARHLGSTALHVNDAYLACACIHRVPGAWAVFEAGPFRDACAALAYLAAPADRVADATQAVFGRLLGGTLADYAGRGKLRTWLKVMLTRELLRRLRGERREVPLDCRQLAHHVTSRDPEADYMRQVYRNEFRRAFGDAVRELPPRERRLLRYRFVQGFGIDGLAAVLSIHRATAARQLGRTRDRLIERTRALLCERLALPAPALPCVLRQIQSQIDVDLERLLA